MAGDPIDLARRLSAVKGRAACTDAERRAARLLARELRDRGRDVRVDTFWVRPAWGAVQAFAMALGVAGSVASVDNPPVGLGLLLGALVLLLADMSGRASFLRYPTYARATQNVVSRSDRDAPVRLIVTAAVDAPRAAMLARGLPRVREVVVAALVALIALTAARETGAEGLAIGLVQLVPTVVLLVAAAAFIDAMVATPSAGANANAGAAAVALALTDTLDRSPPHNLAVDLVLAGAGEAGALGMRHELRARRRAGAQSTDVVVLHVAPCGTGSPVWWTREGPLLPLRYHHRLVELAAEAAAAERHLGARPHESRTYSGARAARAQRWPAIAIGCAGADGPEHLDADAMRAALEFGLALVHRLDADLRDRRRS